MDNPILIRVIGFGIIAIVGAVIKNNTQKRNDKSLSKLKRKDLDLPTTNFQFSEINNENKSDIENIKLVEDKQDLHLIDTYKHPNFYTNTSQFAVIVILWGALGVFIPWSFIEDLSILNCLIVTVINVLFAWLFWYLIEQNKKKILINLFSNRLTFTKESGELIFDLPLNRINSIQLEAESNRGSVYPSEYIILNIDPEFVSSFIEPILSKDIAFSDIIKIKYSDYGAELKGVNSTNIKLELFNKFYE